jgi:hypothetical protein
MKKWISFLIVACLLFVVQSYDRTNDVHSSAQGALAGHTGSPDDGKTCATGGCHSGTPVPTMNLITSNIPVTGYVPGQTYTISATVNDPAKVKFGFQISPQDASGNYLGTMVITEPSATKLTGFKYITHTFGGTSAPGGTRTWNFDWVAPAAGTGDVTFYGAFNYSNNNSSTSGDQIRTSTLTVSEDISTGLANSDDPYNTVLYPVPAADVLNIRLSLNDPEQLNIDLTDLSGKVVAVISQNEVRSTGNLDLKYNIPAGIDNGIYFVRIQSLTDIFTKRIVILR